MNKSSLVLGLIVGFFLVFSFNTTAWNPNPGYNPFEVLWNSIDNILDRLDIIEDRQTEFDARLSALEGDPWPEDCKNGEDDNYNSLIDCADSLCDGESCDDADGICFDDLCCTPDCTDKECGDDGCGGICGTCEAGESCDPDTFQCMLDDMDEDGYAPPEDCDDEDPSVFPGATEVCNGIDDDCDELVDEDLSAPSCLFQAGVCSGSLKTCGGADGWLECTSEDYGADYEPGTETSCDGLDNDCDGMIDEELQQVCGSDIGQCETGLMVCDSGMWGECIGDIEPIDEVCDGLDNDCDGEIDEGGVCGDTCASAISIDSVPFTDTKDTNHYSNDYEPSCSGPTGALDVAYVFTAPTTGTYTATLDSSFDSVIYAVTDCADVAGSTITCSDFPEEISFTIESGDTVYIIVDGYALDKMGSYTLDVMQS